MQSSWGGSPRNSRLPVRQEVGSAVIYLVTRKIECVNKLGDH